MEAMHLVLCGRQPLVGHSLQENAIWAGIPLRDRKGEGGPAVDRGIFYITINPISLSLAV